MKNKSKIFNIKTFVILVCVTFVAVLAVAAVMNTVNKKKFEDKKQQAKENPMKVYENNINSTLSDFIKACGWKEDDIDCIVFGVNTGDSQLSKYYVDDKEIMNRIFDEFEEVTFYGANNDAIEQKDIQNWSVQFIKNGEEHSLFLRGFSTSYDSVEVFDAVACYPEYDAGSSNSFPYVRKDKGYTNMLYDEDMYDNLMKIYNEYIDEITKDTLKALKDENSTELTDYFRYTHSFQDAKEFTDETGRYRLTWIYRFPIRDSECYMEVERYNEFSETEEFKCLDIMRIEIFNSAGESIDFMNCTVAELEDFLK